MFFIKLPLIFEANNNAECAQFSTILCSEKFLRTLSKSGRKTDFHRSEHPYVLRKFQEHSQTVINCHFHVPRNF